MATAALTLLLVGLHPEPAPAQDLIPGLLGGGLGLAAGGYTSLGIWTLKARRGEYLYSVEDALGWESAPVLIGAGAGFLIGISDPDRLRRTVIGGAVGGFVGTGVGVVMGANLWEPPEGRWAGGIIGGGAGLLVGSLVGMLIPGGDDGGDGDVPAAVPFVISIPIR